MNYTNHTITRTSRAHHNQPTPPTLADLTLGYIVQIGIDAYIIAEDGMDDQEHVTVSLVNLRNGLYRIRQHPLSQLQKYLSNISHTGRTVHIFSGTLTLKTDY